MKKSLIVFLLIASTLRAQVSLVSHTVAAGAGAPSVTTVPINTAGANFIAVCAEGNTSIPSKPLDSNGNTWQLANTQNESNNSRVSLWYTTNPVTSGDHTFTLRGGKPSLAVLAFSGIASGLDQQSQSMGHTPITAGALAPNKPNELVLSCASMSYSMGVYVSASPLTLLDQVASSDPSKGGGVASAYLEQKKATPVNPTWNGKSMGGVVADTFYSTLSPGTLTITSPSLPEGVKGTPYSYQLQATGGIAPYVWTLTSGTLPVECDLNKDGLLTCTKATPVISAAPLTFRVTDAQQVTSSTSGFALTVASEAFSMAAGTCPAAGKQYEVYEGCTLTAKGGTPPYSFSYSTSPAYNTLPEGLTLSTTGAVHGTVYGQGNYKVNFIGTDSLGTTATKAVVIPIAGSNTVSFFPEDSIFHARIDELPVDNSPAAPFYSGYLQAAFRPEFDVQTGGIPYLVVPWDQPMVSVTVKHPNSAKPSSSFTSGPIPSYAPVEAASSGGGDRHTVIYRQAGGGMAPQLWEMEYSVYNKDTNSWGGSFNYHHPDVGKTGSGAYAIVSGQDDGGTSDAAGLPIAPFLTTADEVIGTGTPSAPNGSVQHAQRLMLNHMLGYYVWPATAQAGMGSGSCKGGHEDYKKMLLQSDPPTEGCAFGGAAGEMYRIKATTDTPACMATSPQAAIIFDAWKKYGLIIADNGLTGSVTFTADARWNRADLSCLNKLRLSDLEPINVSSIAVNLQTSYKTKTNAKAGGVSK